MLVMISSLICDGYGEDTSAGRSGTMTAEYAQGLNYERWRGLMKITRRFDERSSFRLDEGLTVWLHDIPGYHPQWKMDQKLDYEFKYSVTPEFSWLVSGNTDRFLDRKTDRIGIEPHVTPLQPLNSEYSEFLPLSASSSGNSIFENYVGVGLNYQLHSGFNTKVNFGPLHKNKHDVVQDGFRMSAEIDGSDEFTSWQSSAWRDHLPNGSDYGLSGAFSGNYTFSDQAEDRFFVDYSFIDRQQPSVDNAAFHRKDESIKLSNHLISGITTNLPVAWKSEMSRERTDHISSLNRYSDLTYFWNNDVEMGWQSGTDVSGNFSGGIDIQQQQYFGRLNRGRRMYLGFMTTYLAASDTITVSSKAARYRFDTPDEADKNDRDELRYISEIRYSKPILPGFSGSVSLETDLTHLVYLYRPRSIENRWTRLFSLSSDFHWQSKSHDNLSRFKVVSHYSDYDYSPATESQSRVFRSFTAEDSLSVKVNKVLSLDTEFVLILDDHGRFRWDEWVQDLSEKGISTSTSLQSHWRIDQFRTGIGWQWHKRKTTIYLPTDETEPGESVMSSGPKFSFVYPYFVDDEVDGLQVRLDGSIMQVKDRLRGDYRLPDFRLSAAYTF